MNDAIYDPGLKGQKLPQEAGSTGDDRMDLACTIGADLLPLDLALAAAERILLSKWYAEAVSA